MKNGWYSTHELLSVAGLPGTRQGLCDRARRENWVSRPRAGGQGRGLEYAFDTLPQEVQLALRRKVLQEEGSQDYQAPRHQHDALSAWTAIYHQFSAEERDKIIAFVMREGIAELLERLGINASGASRPE